MCPVLEQELDFPCRHGTHDSGSSDSSTGHTEGAGDSAMCPGLEPELLLVKQLPLAPVWIQLARSSVAWVQSEFDTTALSYGYTVDVSKVIL